ncbi:MAG TPA: helix-turn-helix transcriptional regulator [Bacillota bacterium]|nr:helix-turn-helix transcriptional regulator [Bacillota bacterium]
MWKVGRCLLRERLREARMTQQELASRLNTTKQKVNDYAHGRRPISLELAYTISLTIGCSIESLFEWVQE